MNGPLLIVLLKAPRMGFVKTRLARAVGDAMAADIYRQVTQRLLERLRSLSPVELHYDPPDARAEIEPWRRPSWKIVPQSGGSLGDRLKHAFENAFARGASPVAVIGSDAPQVTRADVERAWRRLASCDVVLGPAWDGGYWLIGLRAPQPALFEEIPWSTPHTLDATLGRAAAARLSTALLRKLRDVDTLEDWIDFQKRNKARLNS